MTAFFRIEDDSIIELLRMVQGKSKVYEVCWIDNKNEEPGKIEKMDILREFPTQGAEIGALTDKINEIIEVVNDKKTTPEEED